MRKIPLVSLLVFVVTAVHAQETLLLGPQIYVNSTTTGPQSSASVSGRTNGEFVVSWADVYPAPQCSVRAQSFSPTGTRMEDEKTAYLCPAGDTDIRTTEVFAQETGQFVVVWTVLYLDDVGLFWYWILLNRMDTDGTILANHTVSSEGWETLDARGLSGNSEGEFVVTWNMCCLNSSWDAWVEAQQFDAEAVPKGEPFVVRYGVIQFNQPDVAVAPDGHFVTVWRAKWPNNETEIFGKVYGPNGQQLGGEFPVNENTQGNQGLPRVAVTASGEFLVVWQSSTSTGTDEDGTSIQGRWFDELGIPLGPDFQVNSLTSNEQTRPTLAIDSEGRAIVAWEHTTAAGDIDIMARLIPRLSLPVSPEFRVNTETEGDQSEPAIAVLGSHDFVVVWAGPGDGDGTGIFGQRIGVTLVFSDGFESGDVLAWSGWVPRCSVNSDCNE